MLAFYNEFGIKPIQRDWNGFFAASVCEGTASQKIHSSSALSYKVSVLFRLDYIANAFGTEILFIRWLFCHQDEYFLPLGQHSTLVPK